MNEIQIILSRLDSVIDSLKNQNSGADVHTVANIRGVALMLKELLELDPGSMTHETMVNITKRAEQDVVKFYRNKYPSRSPGE